jgi:hypothetical protein
MRKRTHRRPNFFGPAAARSPFFRDAIATSVSARQSFN